ncbi:MAG: DNA polymerase III subunit beta [Syntrophaceae bacterium]|nr:DNA polymerase III subunit beta [Syntrophaceae bacterium]
MEFLIDKGEFTKGLFLSQSVVEKKGTMPILLNVLIETKENAILITATDLEIGIKGQYPGEVQKPGNITLSAKKLYEVVKELPEKRVSFRMKENQWVEIKSGKSLFNIMGVSAETFPSFPAYEEEEFILMEAAVLREMIEKTLFAVSTDESRYNLTGVFFTRYQEEEGQKMRMVATDGYRLSLIDRGLKAEIGGLEKGILLPKKGLVELSRLLEEEGEEIWLKLKNNNLIVKKENVVLIMRLLDAEFPDYHQVIPTQTKRRIRMKRNHLLESLKRVSILSSEKTKGVKFHFAEDLLELSSYNPDFGEAKEEFSIEYRGEELTVGFNYRFILEVLNILSSEEIVMEFEDGVSPAIIRPANDEKHTCVVMPMRI